MQISQITFNFNNFKPQLRFNNLRLKTLNADTVSFSGTPKRNYSEEIKNLEEDCFPSSGLREFILSKSNNPDIDILDLHREYYSKLLDCKSLDEAKEIYPEFKNVIDAKDVDLKTVKSTSAIGKIAAGKVCGIKIEDLSLELLKKFFVNLTPITATDKYYGFSGNTTSRLLSSLNIGMNNKYYSFLQDVSKSRNAKANWQNPDCVAKHMKARQNPEYKSKISSLWQNPEYRAAHLAKRQDPEYIKRHKEACSTDEFRAKASKNKAAYWQSPESREVFRTPEARARRSKISSSLWQTLEYQTKLKEAFGSPEYKLRRRIISDALKVAWEEHPYAKEACSEVAKDYPRLGTILTKIEDGIPLTSEENCYHLSYCSAIDKRYPGLKQEVGTIQSELLQSWGYKKGLELEKLQEILDKITEKYEL